MESDPPGSPTTGSDESSTTETTEAPPKPRFFFGWWIVGAGTLTSVIHTVVYNLGASTLFLPVAEEFQTSRTAISGAFALSRLEGGLTGPIEGFLIHWIGPRKYIMFGWAVFGLGLIALGLSQSVFHFYLAFLLATLGQASSGFLPIMTVLVNWFNRKRGKAIALYQLGTSIGAVFVTGFAWLVINVGWRPTIIGAGVAVIVLGMPLAALMRYRPEDYGLLPDGDQASEYGDGSSQGETAAEDGEAQPTIREVYRERGALAATAEMRRSVARSETWAIFRSRRFWLLGTAHSASLTGWGALRVHMIPAMVDVGLTEQVGASLLAFSIFVSGGGRLIGGFLGDMIGPRLLLMTAFLAQAGSVVLFAFADNFIFAGIASAIFGIAFGARGTLLIMLRGEIFGRESFSRLSGLMDVLTMFGVAVTPIFAGAAYDILGGYTEAFLIIAAVNGAGALLLLAIHIPKKGASASVAE